MYTSTFLAAARKAAFPVPGRYCSAALLAGLWLALSGAAQAQNPTVLSVSPARNATSAARTADVVPRFTLNISSASAGNLRVFGSQLRGRRPGTLSGQGTSTLTFNPSQDFAPGEVVSVSLPATMLSASNGSALSKHVYQFTAAVGGTGRGNFAATPDSVAGSGPVSVAAGDVDNDGDLDFVTANSFGFEASVRLNNGNGTFSGRQRVLVGGSPKCVALGDVDNDGDLDLVTADAQNNPPQGSAVSICRNDGAGNFTGTLSGAQTVLVGQSAWSVALGDIDADGDLDFVTANIGDNTASIRFNNGSGVFSGSGSVAVGAGPVSVALADVDNDGDLDLLTANADDNTVSIRLNNGNGVFSGAASVAVGLNPSHLAVADFDNDGDLDLATTNYQAGTVSIRLNNGSGSFTARPDVAIGTNPIDLTFGDVDADGDLDLLAANRTGVGSVSVRLNQGGGNFAGALEVPVSSSPESLALADFDGDSDLDFITVGSNGSLASVRLNQVNVAPSITGIAPARGPVGTTVTLTGTNFSSITGIAFNGIPASGYVVNLGGTSLTVAVPAGATTGPVTVSNFVGTATSAVPFQVVVPVPVTAVLPARNTQTVGVGSTVAVTFAEPITSASAGNLRVFGNQRRGLRPGTLSGQGTSTLTFDPAQDFAPGEQVSVSIPASLQGTGGGDVQPQVFQFTAAAGGTGAGFFAGATEVTLGSSAGVSALSDVDNDGDLDLVAVVSQSGVAVQLNNGSGTFTPLPNTIPVFGTASLALGDVDADGDLDLVVSNGSTTVYRNNGTGTFSNAGTVSLGNVTAANLALADLDADGDLDLLSTGNGQVDIRLNNGTGTFSGSGYVTSAQFTPTGLAVGDVDNDGDLDLVTANSSNFGQANSVSVRLNDGAGSFSAGQDLAVGVRAVWAALNDVDGDGDLDILAHNAADNTVSLRLNNGTGTFSGTTTLPITGLNPVLADIDADGDADLLMGSGSGTVSIRLNNGNGSFSSLYTATLQTNFPTTFLALGDLDNDGDLDVVATGANFYSSTKAAVSFNQVAPAPVVSAISPSSGPVGFEFLVLGSHFLGVRSVLINGTAATRFTVVSPTRLLVTVPSGATSGPVSVVTSGGTGVSATPFTVTQTIVVASISPARHTRAAGVGSTVAVTFAEPITSASAGNLHVFGSQRRGLRPGTLSGQGTSTLTFDPAQDFAPGEQVSVSIPASLQGNTGGSAARQVAQFTAAAGGTGRGNFAGTDFTTMTGTPLGGALGDLDNDGDLDVVVARGDMGILRNNGAGSFGAPQYVAIPRSNARAVALGDLNNDGSLDAVFVGFDGTYLGQLNVFLNNGSGTLQASASLSVGQRPQQVALGDMDADGDLDVVAVDYQTDSAYVFLNTRGSFARISSAQVSSRPIGLSLADIDNDGDLDLVTASETVPASVSVRLNNGNGIFGTAGADLNLSTGTRPDAITTGDVDGDGDLDIVVAGLSSTLQSYAFIRLNDGNSNFSGTQAVPVGAQPESVLLRDVDADGDLDLLTGNTSANTVSLRINDGAGIFSGTLSAPVADTPWALDLGDLDNDGDLDLVTTNSSSGGVRGVSVRLNLPAAPVVSSFTPVTGAPGTRVTVTGAHFTGALSVQFNGASAAYTVVSDTELTTTVPNSATTGPIQVFTQYGSGTSATSFMLPTPTLVSFSPGSGGAGLRVTLTGAYLTGATSVTFNGLAAIFTQVSATEITATAPVGVTTGLIVVRTPSGTATSASSFVVLAAPVVTSLSPGRNATNVARTANVQLSFSRAISNASAGNLRVFGSQRRGRRPGTTGVDATGALAFDPDQDFAPGEAISITLPTSVQGAAGGDVVRQTYQFTAATEGSGRGRFADGSSRTLPGQGTPHTLVLGDVDNDGHLDIVTAKNISGGTYGLVDIQRNNGNGTFSSWSSLTMSAEPAFLALGDVDADGDLDLVTPVGVGRNDGTGRFTVATGFWPFINGRRLRLGDVDADGDLDLILVSAGRVQVGLNDGTGTFSPGALLTSGQYISSLEIGDLDNDGDLDLLAGDGNSTQYDVLLNDGAATFTAGATLTMGGSAQDVVLGDVDADGDLDIVSAEYILSAGTSGLLGLCLNNGNATFGSHTILHSFNYTVHPREVRLGDIDADGDLDLVYMDGGINGISNVIHLKYNNGSGAFSTGPDAFVGYNPYGPALGDVDNDGDLDLVTPVDRTVSIRLNQPPTVTMPVVSLTPARNSIGVARSANLAVGFGQATASSTAPLHVFGNQRQGLRPGTASGAGTATLAFDPTRDFMPGEAISVTVPGSIMSSDGTRTARPEVVQLVAAATGSGRGSFSGSLNLPMPGQVRAVATADIDSDGDLDLLVSGTMPNGYSGVMVRLNNGDATFTSAPDMSVDAAPSDIVVGDIDGDGDLDFIVANSSSNTLPIRLNNGNGTFTDGDRVFTFLEGHTLALGDVDADGDLDLLIGNKDRNTVSVRFNTGAGMFYGTMEVPTGAGPHHFAVGDVDNDGDLDIVTANYDANTISIRLNDGLGTFGITPDLPVGTQPEDVALGDLDGDGDLDLTVANAGSGTVSVLRNSGSGTFAAAGSVALAPGLLRLTLADLDADNDLDLLVSGGTTASTRLNDGSGNFSGNFSTPLGNSPTSLALGDLDNDGDIDVAAANTALFANTVSVRLNGGTLASKPATTAQQLQLYPNPARQQFTVRLPVAAGIKSAQLLLLTGLGQPVRQQTVAVSGGRLEAVVEVAGLPAGVYQLQLAVDGLEPVYRKVVVQ